MTQYPDDANPVDVEEQATPMTDDEQEQADETPAPREEVDEGDLLEQATPVSGADDDYPNDLEAEPDV